MIRMMMLPALMVLVFAVFASGCVTTSSSPFAENKDLSEAVETYTQIGYRHFQNNNLFEAKQSLNQALSIDRKAAGAHLGLARVFDVEQDDDLAESHFKKAIRYGGGTEALFQYGVFLYNHQRYEDAFEVFGKVAEDKFYGRRALSFEFLALAARRVGDQETAIKAYERAIVLDRLLVNSYVGLADVYESRDQPAKAMNAYQGFLSLVRADKTTHTPHTLWLGIRLADATGNSNLLSSLELQLRSRFPGSDEYRRYQLWQLEKGAA